MGKRYREPPPPIATFEDLLKGDEKWTWINCSCCRHRVALPFAPYAIRWGMRDEATTRTRRHFRCSRCGEKATTLTMPSHSVSLGEFQAFPVSRGLQVLSDHAWLDNMCNLYSLHSTREEIGKWLRVSQNRMAHFPEELTMFPAREAPVVRMAEDGERELVSMSWGFVLLQDSKAPRRVTNTREDKIESPFWRQSIAERRCLVPATSFAEPDDLTPVQWHWFAVKGETPRPIFCFAGIWRRYKGPIKKDGETVEIDTYSFMTTKPNKFTERINHDRLPAILATPEEQDAWLNGTRSQWHSLLKPFPASRMNEVQVGKDKKDLELPLIQPIQAGD
jgi:putative SOS response-associated peptidase YedK